MFMAVVVIIVMVLIMRVFVFMLFMPMFVMLFHKMLQYFIVIRIGASGRGIFPDCQTISYYQYEENHLSGATYFPSTTLTLYPRILGASSVSPYTIQRLESLFNS